MTTTPNIDSTLQNSTLNRVVDSSCKMYKGVRKRKWGKWVSEIRLPNSRERIWLGSYDTQQKAARAFDAALYCLRGRHASFNFPDTPLHLEINNVSHYHSLSHHEIQQVASKFANNFDAEEEEEPSSQNGANSASSVCDYDGSNNNNNNDDNTNNNVQVDHGDMDWTFLNVLDDQNDSNFDNTIGYDFGLYYGGIDKVHSGEFLYTTTPPTTFEDNNNGDADDDDAFSNHSFLWSWNF
ncbi:hypothetical protein S83_020881 [Arachis hypogaea]